MLMPDDLRGRIAFLGPCEHTESAATGANMKHYRINKVAKIGGPIIKKKDVLARNDEQAMERARDDEDCPVCEVFEAGKKVGSIDHP